MHLHWDGDNDSVDERNLSAALGAGVTPVTVDHANLKRVRDWIWTLPPPTYPYPVDQALAAAGRRSTSSTAPSATPTADSATASSRARASARSSRSTRSAPIGTGSIPTRRRSPPTSTGCIPSRRTASRTSGRRNGYANQPLDGIWLRGPYLHNGSVPTLRDLLDPPDAAAEGVLPRQRRVRSAEGRIRLECAGGRRQAFTRYDTRVPGNSNSGHVYGTTLSDDDKRAIVEYLKTF